MRISIVGAGFCGTALASQLARTAGPDLEICLIGEPASFGRGVAYGCARPEHFLNVRAGDMGLEPENPGGFADWLELSDGSRHAFLPRHLFGEYLSRQLSAALANSPAKLRAYTEDVISVERIPGGFRVYLADGSDFFSDQVVLAVGTLPPQPLPALDTRLSTDSRYVNWPWREGVLDAIPRDARVLILGTGLTMADVVMSLNTAGHTGPIHAVSRHGIAPLAHGRPRRSTPTPPALLKAIERSSLRGLLRTLREMSRVSDDWRPLVDSLRPHTQSLWKRLTVKQRMRFLRHLKSYWEVHRHRVAPEVADCLEQLRGSGQLKIDAGHLLHARLDRGTVEAYIRPRGTAHAQCERYDFLVRATGFDTDIDTTTHALIAHLRASELIRPDPYGLGIACDDLGEVLDRHGRRIPGLFCIGPLQRGRLWEITAVPELRTAARDLARHLVNTMASRTAGAPRNRSAGTRSAI
ncbi:MAG: FAD/NAD(P)-binding protein [Xanthomonadaceae bacterium]|nr:FAD/NAD(P)-binding protein [Xanthomonadaceae bacterium]